MSSSPVRVSYTDCPATPASPVGCDDARLLIANCALFRGLDPECCQALLAKIRFKKFAAGEIVFRMDDNDTSMMVVIRGAVRLSLSSSSGKEVVIGVMHSGEFFGEVAMLDGGARNLNATAMTPSSLAVIERQHVLSLLNDRPDAYVSIATALCDRLRRTNEHLAELTFLDISTRLARALLRLRTPLNPANGQSGSEVRVSQHELGNIIGATRESVNKCLREWQMQGLLDIGVMAITIKDLPGLRMLSRARDDRRAVNRVERRKPFTISAAPQPRLIPRAQSLQTRVGGRTSPSSPGPRDQRLA
jgi:CRP/FNR family cyclic AMP-dependent transcriptional regulator